METSSYDKSQIFWALCYGLAYLVFAATTVISNKHLITNTNFHSAIFVSSLGSWFGWIVSLGMVWSKRTTLVHNLTLKEWTVSVLPIGLATACSLAAANVALRIRDTAAADEVFSRLHATACEDEGQAHHCAVECCGCARLLYNASATSARLLAGLQCLLLGELISVLAMRGARRLLSQQWIEIAVGDLTTSYYQRRRVVRAAASVA